MKLQCSAYVLSRDVSWLLLDQAKLAEGMIVKDPVAFTQRLNRVMAKSF